MQNSKYQYTPTPNDPRMDNNYQRSLLQSQYQQQQTQQKQLTIEEQFVSQYNNREDKIQQEEIITLFLKKVSNGYDRSRIIYQIAICPFRQYKFSLFQIASDQILRDQSSHNEIRRAFTVSYFKELIENCEQIEVIGLALRLNNQLVQLSPTPSQQSRDYLQFKDQVVEFIDSKIENLVTVNELDRFFLTNILQQLAESKTNNNTNMQIKPQELSELYEQIYVIIDEVLNFNIDKLQSVPNYLLRIMMKWMLILPSMSDKEIKYIQKLINIITQRALSYDSEQNYDINKLSELFQFIFQTMKIQWSNRDPIRPNQNLQFLIEALGNVTQQFFENYSCDIAINFFNPSETVVILNNLIDCGYTGDICLVIYQIIRSLLPFRRFDIIKEIHTEFIMNRIINKIQCKNCIPSTLALIKETLFGLAKVVYITDDQVQTMVKQYKFIIKFKSILNTNDLYSIHEFFYLIQQNRDITKGLNSASTQQIKDIVNQGIESKIINIQDSKLRLRVDRMLGQDVYLTNELNKIQCSNQLSGLINLGNTCYINSYMHSLYHAFAFREFIIQFKPQFDQTKVFSSFVDPIEEIKKVFLKMYCLPQQQDIDPKQLKKSLPEPFRSSMEQQDTGEFGKFYLDYIQSYLKDTEFKDEIDKFFFGQIENRTQCQSCKVSCKKIEKIHDIYVNFCDQAYDKYQNTYDLVSMIRNSFQAETFDENNAYFCENCNKKTTAIKNTLVKILPPYLTVTIGRFQYDKQRQERVKLLYPMNLPMSFNIADLFENAQIPSTLLSHFDYQLYAFIVHLGSQIDAGHYIAYGRNLEDPNGKWKLYDDNFVTEQLYPDANDLAKNFAESETPYILFYANKKHMPIELHKYIRSKRNKMEEEEVPQNGYFYNNQSASTNVHSSQNGNRFQNNFKKI